MTWLDEVLQSGPGWMNFGIFFALGIVMLAVTLGFVAYAILAERKVMGFFQMRIGPNRLGGKYGLIQTVADILKLLTKEDVVPKAADKFIFLIAPGIAFVPSFMVMAALPFTDAFKFSDIGVGLLYYISISGITTLGMVAGGWASNNKYSLLGGMRAAAQMISYEIPLVMSVIGVILFTGSLNLIDIVNAQEHWAYFITQPIGFVVFIIAATAELNRTPFDLPESESELVSGYHTEYSGFRFAFYMLTEYVYLFAMSALITILFLGGWNPIPGLGFIPGAAWFAVKLVLVVFFYMWLRSTFPRLRADHLMEFGWKVLLPISLANVFLSALIKALFF